MFANRFTALVDACTLVSLLKRNLLLSLAEAGFFRLRWSGRILDETETAIEKILSGKGVTDADVQAERARNKMEAAFEDAMVVDFDKFLCVAAGLPDPGDAHVVAAAVKTKADMIVTENLKHFPAAILASLNMEAKSADEFIADTIALEEGRAVAAIRQMRERFKKPAMNAEALLLKMEADGLLATADLLRPYVESLQTASITNTVTREIKVKMTNAWPPSIDFKVKKFVYWNGDPPAPEITHWTNRGVFSIRAHTPHKVVSVRFNDNHLGFADYLPAMAAYYLADGRFDKELGFAAADLVPPTLAGWNDIGG